MALLYTNHKRRSGFSKSVCANYFYNRDRVYQLLITAFPITINIFTLKLQLPKSLSTRFWSKSFIHYRL